MWNLFFPRKSKREIAVATSLVCNSKFPEALFDRKGELLSASESFWSLFGLTSPDRASLPIELTERIKQAITEPAGKSIEIQVPTGKAHKRVFANIQVLDFGVFFTSELPPDMKAEARKRSAFRNLKSVFNGFDSPIAAVDDNWFFKAANKSFLDCFGFDKYTEDILEGITVIDLFSFVDSAALSQVISALRAKQNLKYYRLSLFSGERRREFAVHLNNSTLDGVPVTFIVLVDITKYEKEMMALNEQLEDAKKQLEARTSIIGYISHEIRNAFNIFLNEMLVSEESASELGGSRSESVRRLKLLNSLISDILEFTRLDAKQITPNRVQFSPRDLGYDLLRIFSKKATEKGLEFVVEYSSDLPEKVLGDPSRITEILINIITNAIKYVDVGKIEMSISYSAPELVYKVRDTGIGLHPTQQQKLFEKFYRTVDSSLSATAGTGLGLTITKKLIELLGGSLRMSSSPGEGTTFVISIPVTVSSEAIKEPEPYRHLIEIIDKLEVDRPRLLVVDDDESALAYYRVMLSRLGVSFDIATSASDALAKIEGSVFDVVVTDDQMPVMTGTQLAQALRDRYNNSLLLILITGLSKCDIKQPQLFDFVAEKPVDVSFWKVFASLEDEESYFANRDSLVDDHYENYIKDPELFAMLEEYVEFISESVGALEEYIQAGKYDNLFADMHTIKGTSGTYGLSQIRELAERICDMSKEKVSMEEIRPLFRRLVSEIGFARNWLAENRPEVSKPTAD